MTLVEPRILRNGQTKHQRAVVRGGDQMSTDIDSRDPTAKDDFRFDGAIGGSVPNMPRLRYRCGWPFLWRLQHA